MVKTSDILDRLGRDRVATKLGLAPSSLSDAIRDERFPARWYGPMKALADADGFDLPLDAFHWRAERSARLLTARATGAGE